MRRDAPRALLLLLAILAGGSARGAGARERPSFGYGVTPGGLVWSVSLKTERIVLRGYDGSPRGSYPLAPGERMVLSVGDDGSRVTARRPWGLMPVEDGDPSPRTQSARLYFRGPSGELLARRNVTVLAGTTPAAVGADVYILRRDGKSLAVVRVSATEAEAPVAKIPLEPIWKELGTRAEARLSGSPAGLVVHLEGGGRTAYVLPSARPRTVFVDPSLTCGWSDLDQALHPNGLKGISRVTSRAAKGPRTPSPYVLEALDADGKLASVTPIGTHASIFPVEGGELLVFRPGELTRLDDRGGEISRVPFSIDPDRPGSEALVDALNRLRTRGGEATGRDWAELALLPGAPIYEFRAVLARDPAGALARLAQVPDGSASLPQARVALRTVLGAATPRRVGGAVTEPLTASIRLVEAGGPAWFRRAVAFPAVTALKDRAPAWALPSIAEAAVLGEGGDESLALPGNSLPAELVQLIVALDRGRMDRIDRDGPPLHGPLLLSELADPDAGRFHLPAGRATPVLFDCFAGAGPVRFQAALEALAAPAMELGSRRASERRGDLEPGDGGALEDASAGLVARLVEARRAEDQDIRAGALLLAPFYAVPIDAERFRLDVLSRPDLPLLAAGALTFDASLPSAEWQRLFGESLAAARAQSRDPGACAAGAAAAGRDADEDPDDADPYCVFVEGILRFAQSPPDSDGDDLAPRRAAEIAAWSRSAAAPPELRTQARIARILEGSASDEELASAWRDTTLPWGLRRSALSARLAHVPAGAAEEWRRELRQGRGSPREEAALIGALRLVDAGEAGRLAVERVRAGRLDAPRAEASEWLDALEPSAVASDEGLRSVLRSKLEDEEVGAEVAAVLARAGDRDAFPYLVSALRTGCTRCLGTAALLDLLARYGPDGRDALETLGRTLDPEMAATAVDALFELDPSRAAAVAQERLAGALAADCVPQGLVRVLLERDLDPFPAVAARLSALDCRREALRPAGSLRVEDGAEKRASRTREAAARIFPPACREAFETLFGIDERERER